MSTRFVVELPDREPLDAQIEEHDHGYVIVLGERTYHIDYRSESGSPTRSMIVDGLAYEAATFQDKDSWDVFISGDAYRVKVMDALWAQAEVGAGDAGGAEVVRSPMPGGVVKILVAEGDTVTPGQPVIVVEAMKMQNELTATHGGRVSGIHVSEGDTVEEDAPLLEIDPPEEA